MAPTIHLVRHAQGFHNLAPENDFIQDPELTPLGEEQCAALRAAFPDHARVTHLVASPLRRTLATAVAAFGTPALYPLTALDVLQEVSDAPCDTGSGLERLRGDFGDKVDLARVRAEWMEKGEGSVFEPTLEALTARAKESRRALRDIAGNGDEHVVAVSHGGFLHFLTDDWQGIPGGSGEPLVLPSPCRFRSRPLPENPLTADTVATGWANCEYRSYHFVDPTGADEDAALVETDESWRRRQPTQKPLSALEQRELRIATQRRVIPNLKIKAQA